MFFKCHIFQEYILCILHFSIMVHEVKIDDLAIQIFRTSLLSFCVLVLLVMRGVLKFQTTSHGFTWFRLFLTEDLPCSASCTWSTSSEGSSYAESACHKRNSVDNTGRALATRGPGSSAIPVTTHASGAHN